MRKETSLSILAIVMAFLSGLLVLSVKNSGTRDLSLGELRFELQKFQGSAPVLHKFEPGAYFEFIDPKNQLPFYQRFELKELQGFKAYEDCQGPLPTPEDRDLQKMVEWQRSLCEKKPLSLEFFRRAPHFHPSGKSYAYLEIQRHGPRSELLDLLHALELRELKLAPSQGPMKSLSLLSWEELYQVVLDEKIIIGAQSVFIKSGSEKEFYFIYPKIEWDEFWKDSLFHPVPLNYGQVCYFKDGNVCWNYDVTRELFKKWNVLTISLALSVTLTLLLLWMLYNRMRQRQVEEEKLTFALEMLAHEIRTPVTTMALSLDDLRAEFDSLRPVSQSSLLRLFDQVERLKRIVSTSHNYLRKELGPNLIKTNIVEISSLHSFIESAIEPFLDQVELHFIDDDRGARLDPYWVSTCLKNIVENALVHGEKPVIVKVRNSNPEWSFEVSDAGMKGFSHDQKGEESPGLGIGLKLVEVIMRHLQGNLTVSYQPTKVTLSFKDLV